jgi:hypothetical protein
MQKVERSVLQNRALLLRGACLHAALYRIRVFVKTLEIFNEMPLF